MLCVPRHRVGRIRDRAARGSRRAARRRRIPGRHPRAAWSGIRPHSIGCRSTHPATASGSAFQCAARLAASQSGSTWPSASVVSSTPVRARRSPRRQPSPFAGRVRRWLAWAGAVHSMHVEPGSCAVSARPVRCRRCRPCVLLISRTTASNCAPTWASSASRQAAIRSASSRTGMATAVKADRGRCMVADMEANVKRKIAAHG